MIRINDEQDKVKISEEDFAVISEIFQYLLSEEGIPEKAETSLTFVDNEEIRNLNNEYRNIDSETDVLSFPIYEKAELESLKGTITEEDLLLGDIVISLEKAREQAEEFGHSFKREIIYLFVHGMLHLLGYDHLEEDEKKEMRSREESILEKFAIMR